jgi:uncharacterized protein YkwD
MRIARVAHRDGPHYSAELTRRDWLENRTGADLVLRDQVMPFMRSLASLTLAFSSLFVALFATPSSASANGKAQLDGTERAIVRGINRQRANNGLGGLKTSGGLAKAADFHTWEMLDANYFAHTSRDGGPFDRRVRRFAEHRSVGETLAWISSCGGGAARRIVRMWMESPGHRAILLSASFRRIGVGKRTGSLGSGSACVVTADFGSRR